ncbi:MAG: RNA-binding domain-containing protein [Solirubrobacteraceae bacterium]|jgi:hypothetical protein
MTVFGPEWGALELTDVEAFFREAPPEPLTWEAKGELDPHGVRKAVCGFANAHDLGYVVIGVQVGDESEAWTLGGAVFPNADPPNDVTNLIAGGGVSPYPDGLDVRAWQVADDLHVAVVRVPPVATPPANVKGTVYERVSGKTIPVRDPARLAALFGRGDSARANAQASAERAAHRLLDRFAVEHPQQSSQFALAIAATGYAPDISSRLFTERFVAGARSSIGTVLARDVLLGGQTPPMFPEFSQDALVLSTEAVHPLGWSWAVCASWDGAIAIHWSIDALAQVENILSADGPLRAAWSCAEEVLSMLGPAGPRYLHLIPADGRFPAIEHGPPSIRRGPIGGRDDAVLASIQREMQRATGEAAFEPGAG